MGGEGTVAPQGGDMVDPGDSNLIEAISDHIERTVGPIAMVF